MSLLDKIKNEYESQTVKVPPRQDELLPRSEGLLAETELVSQEEEATKPIPVQSTLFLEKELASLPLITNKKIGVRLEEDIYEEVRKLCQENSITVETLLEAYFTVCSTQPKLVNKIIEEAQFRLKQRTKAGNIRSLLTKTKNLKDR
jgi:hypothetical protein